MDSLSEDEIKRFRELTKQGILKSISELEFGIFTTSAKEEPTPLTLEDFKKMFETVYPILYYKITKFIEPGAIYKIKKTKFFPEYIIFNLEDLDKVEGSLAGHYTLVDISEWRGDYNNLVMGFNIK